MQTPGTAAVVLPAYAAPVFTTPSVKIGDATTSVVFEGTSDVFTFGQVFKVGEVAPTDGLLGRIKGVADIPLQWDVKATHVDGSVRHAIISGKLPPDITGEMFLIRSTARANTIPVLMPREYNSHVVITQDGIEYISTKSDAELVWLNGDFVFETVKFNPLLAGDGAEHPFLTVQFCERVYANGKVKTDIVVEHTKAYKATTDLTYDIKVYVGDTIVYEKLGLVHFPCARYKKTFWYGTKPDLHIKHNSAYLIESRAVPNYDQSVVMSETTLASYATAFTKYSFEPMSVGRFQPGMGTTGGRPDIGVAPDSYAAYVISGDKRAKAVMLASADVAGSWGAHRRDVDGSMFDVIHYPYATILGNLGDTKNPLTGQYEKLPAFTTTSKLTHDSAHQPAFAYIPYLVTGDYFYLEELLFWCNYNTYVSNPYYRMFEQGWIKYDQLRGQGWSIRTMAQAAYITPDTHNQKTTFKFWLDSNMEYYRLNFTDAVAGAARVDVRKVNVIDPLLYNELGIITCGATVSYAIKGIASNGIAMFMNDHFVSGVGVASEMGCEEAKRLINWQSKFQVGRMLAEGYCPNDASIYAIRVRDSAILDPITHLPPPFYKTLKECRDNTKEVDQLGCDPVIELVGYPDQTDGFPANYQPSLAYTVSAGGADSSTAWQLFMSRKTKPNYGTSPQFAIIPRTNGIVVINTPPETLPPTETPPIDIPPVEVPPIVIDTYINISNTVLAGMTSLTVIMENNSRIQIWQNLDADLDGRIKLISNELVKGLQYECTVLNKAGFRIASIFPVTAT